MKKRQKLEIFVSYIKDYHIFKSKVLKQYVIGNNNKGVEDRLKLPRDNTGINISEKNPTFNELTLIYWAWKNTNQDFIGFAHYRRYFVYNNLSFFDMDIILLALPAEPFASSFFQIFLCMVSNISGTLSITVALDSTMFFWMCFNPSHMARVMA